MKRTFDIYEIQVPYKFQSIEECDKKIASLIELIRYHAREKKYFCQGVVVSSELKSANIIAEKKAEASKRGRPKFTRIFDHT